MINLNRENQLVLLEEIKNFFNKERDEELSDFQSQIYLDFILKTAGVYIYNQAIADAHVLMSDKIEELFALEKTVKSNTK